MSITLLSKSEPLARKEYSCDASVWFYNCAMPVENGMFTYEELRAIVKARRSSWCIKPGQKYLKFAQIQDGDFCVFRAIPEMHAICRKYDLYDVY